MTLHGPLVHHIVEAAIEKKLEALLEDYLMGLPSIVDMLREPYNDFCDTELPQNRLQPVEFKALALLE